MQCNAMQCNAMQCNAMQSNAKQCKAMQCNAMQCNAIYTYIYIYRFIDLCTNSLLVSSCLFVCVIIYAYIAYHNHIVTPQMDPWSKEPAGSHSPSAPTRKASWLQPVAKSLLPGSQAYIPVRLGSFVVGSCKGALKTDPQNPWGR